MAQRLYGDEHDFTSVLNYNKSLLLRGWKYGERAMNINCSKIFLLILGCVHIQAAKHMYALVT